MEVHAYLKHDDCDYDQKQESHSNSRCSDEQLIWEDDELNPNFSLFAKKIRFSLFE